MFFKQGSASLFSRYFIKSSCSFMAAKCRKLLPLSSRISLKKSLASSVLDMFASELNVFRRSWNKSSRVSGFPLVMLSVSCLFLASSFSLNFWFLLFL